MKKTLNNYAILLLLATLFIAPGVAAYIFFQHPSWLSATKTNKGTLLNPPIKLSGLDGHSKWRVLFWNPKSCDQACLNQLDVLARMRLALGRKLYQVDLLLVPGKQNTNKHKHLSTVLKNLDVYQTSFSEQNNMHLRRITPDRAIYLVNPDNYLILSYKSGVNPDDIYKDLKLLLNTTESKSS